MRYYITGILAKYDLIAILTIVGIGLLVRLYELPLKQLWYDELIAVTLSKLPVIDILINLRKIEVHPPPYYLQLNLWMLLGTSDVWVKLNSLIWNILAIFSLFYTTRSIFGKTVSILASTLFALSPFAVFYAQEVRPYSLLMFLGIWSWYFTHRYLYGPRSPLIDLGLIASILLFLYGHGAAFLLLLSTSFYAAFYLIENFNRWRYFLRWVVLQISIIILYIPWLYRARSVKMGHAQIPSWENISPVLFTVIFGYGDFSWLPDWTTIVSLILLGMVVFILLPHKIARKITFSFLIIPIVSCIAVSYAISPLWLPRTLAYIFPFWCLSLALTFDTVFFHRSNFERKFRFFAYGLYAILAILLLILSIHQQKTFNWPWNIRDAAKFVSTNASAGDVVYIPDNRLFWAWNWYYSGAGSVNPLTTDYSLITDKRVYVLSRSTIENSMESGRSYWLIYRPMYDIIYPFSSMSNLVRELIIDFNGLTIEKVRFVGRTSY